MNYIELARAVRGRSGLQGTGPASISGAVGAEGDIVQAVSDAWLDIQNYRRNWKWMKAEASINIVTNVRVYTPQSIFGSTTPRLGRWLKDKPAYILVNGKYSPIRWIDPEVFEYFEINTTIPKTPPYFTIDESNKSVVVPLPDSLYTLKLKYMKSPQTLINSADIPEMPPEFHLLIVYAALEKYCVTIGNPEIYQKYSFDYVKLLGSLMRDQLPKENLDVRGLA